jgi:hypothetical protein
MLVAAVAAGITPAADQEGLEEPEEVEPGLKAELQLLEPQILVVVEVEREPQLVQEVLAALVSSSSRPINNEDKWKPKSIGCMESTPQCIC